MLVKKPKVKLNLLGIDGNAFSLMGAFSNAAKRQGWTRQEIDIVLTEARKSNYDHLVTTLFEHTESEK